jgi:hypothetical protein
MAAFDWLHRTKLVKMAFQMAKGRRKPAALAFCVSDA